MLIQINTPDAAGSDAIKAHAQSQVESALKHLNDHVSRVEVHLHDDKHHGSDAHDMRVTMEARINSMDPLAVDANGQDMYAVISDAAGKLGRAVGKKIDKMVSRH